MTAPARNQAMRFQRSPAGLRQAAHHSRMGAMGAGKREVDSVAAVAIPGRIENRGERRMPAEA